MRKAFDSVHHLELIKRMRALELPTIYTDWLFAYLGNRSQRVACNGTVSSSLPVKYGVPQGSILGPLLFICFVNALPNVLEHTKIIMYADDVVFYTSSTDLKKAESDLQSDASKVYDWFCKSGLSINKDKTKMLLFNPPSTPHREPLISMGNTVLKVCTSYEYLGIVLDDCLNFVKTISKTVSTSSNRCFMMNRFRKKVSKPTAILIYKQTILPVLEYCGFLYN